MEGDVHERRAYPTDTTVRFPAAVVGKKFIVWGGQRNGDDSVLNWVSTGSMYDIDSDTWTPINDVGAPTGRTGHILIPAGDKLIVWGGWRVKDCNTTTGPDDGATLIRRRTLGKRFRPSPSFPLKTACLSALFRRVDGKRACSHQRRARCRSRHCPNGEI